jgi:hypothetical protein
VDEFDWVAYRKRVRRRASSYGAFILCPVFILMAVLSFMSPVDYPVGDIRGTIAFRLITSAVLVTVGVGGMVVSARWLLADRQKE